MQINSKLTFLAVPEIFLFVGLAAVRTFVEGL